MLDPDALASDEEFDDEAAVGDNPTDNWHPSALTDTTLKMETTLWRLSGSS